MAKFRNVSEAVMALAYPILFVCPGLMVGSLFASTLPHPADYLGRALGVSAALMLIVLIAACRDTYRADLPRPEESKDHVQP